MEFKSLVQCRIIGTFDSFGLSTVLLRRLTIRVKCCKTRMCSLLLVLEGCGNAVHIENSLLGERLSHCNSCTFRRVESCGSNKAGFFELHQAEADVLSSCLAVVFRFSSRSHLGTVVLAKTIDSNLLAHVELIGDGSCTSVKPVLVIGAQLFLATSLNPLGPLLNIIKISTGID